MPDNQVVTELTIDASPAIEGAQQFETALNDCEAVLDKILASMMGLSGGSGLLGAHYLHKGGGERSG